MREKSIKAQIQIALSKDQSIRLFNQPQGMAWMGEIVSKTPAEIILANYRPVKFGLAPGSSDLIGWRSVEITEEMIGQRLAVFLALEIKSKSGRLRPEQSNFIAVVERAGGIAGVARSIAEACAITFKEGFNGRA